MSDLLASTQLSAGAALVVATYSLAFQDTAPGRSILAAIMTTWFALVCWVGETESLSHIIWLGVPGIGYGVAIPIAVLTTVLLMTSAGRRRVLAAPLPALIAVHVLRVLGFWFVVLYAANRLPAPFAPVAGWGDILAGALALPDAWLAWKSPTLNRRATLIWNVIGAVDLVAAVSLGLLSFPGPLQVFGGQPNSVLMTSLPWIIIPCFLVPTLLTLHVVVFYRLFSRTAFVGV